MAEDKKMLEKCDKKCFCKMLGKMHMQTHAFEKCSINAHAEKMLSRNVQKMRENCSPIIFRSFVEHSAKPCFLKLHFPSIFQKHFFCICIFRAFCKAFLFAFFLFFFLTFFDHVGQFWTILGARKKICQK